MTEVTQHTWDISGITISGLVAAPPTHPRATVLALHGGGYSAGYWDDPLESGASLLRLGAQLGYRVVAVDRPGYGASYGLVADAVRANRQAALIGELGTRLAAEGALGAGLFLIGHSQGSVIAVHLAADDALPDLLGLEIAGLPYRFRSELVDLEVLTATDFLPYNPWERRRNLFYGPADTFDQRAEAADEAVIRPIPAAEIIDAVDAPRTLPLLAPKITVPVQYTVAEFEVSSEGGLGVLEDVRPLFSASPRFVPQAQMGSGHNISLHRVARAYHLRAFAFFDEVLAGRAAVSEREAGISE